MGYNAALRLVLAVLNGLEHVLRSRDVAVPPGVGVEIAREAYLRDVPSLA
ncbi:MAG: hypothetical protein ACRDGN_08225 [bacterium]